MAEKLSSTDSRKASVRRAFTRLLPDDWDKELEAQILSGINCGDTYFHDAFSGEDMMQMRDNIKNDFPLLHMTRIQTELDEAKADRNEFRRELDKVEGHKAELTEMLKAKGSEAFNWEAKTWALVKLMMAEIGISTGESDGWSQAIRDLVGADALVKWKLENDMYLDEQDRLLLLKCVDPAPEAVEKTPKMQSILDAAAEAEQAANESILDEARKYDPGT